MALTLDECGRKPSFEPSVKCWGGPNQGAEMGQIKALPSFWCKQDFLLFILDGIASLFADPNLLQLESEAMINTDNAPSKRRADATAPFTPKARENPDQIAKIRKEHIGEAGVTGRRRRCRPARPVRYGES